MPDDAATLNAGNAQAARPGAYYVWPADCNGDLIDPPPDPDKPDRLPKPGAKEATEIYFALKSSPLPPPADQVALQTEIDNVLGTARKLYVSGTPPREARFRPYYVRLFRIAELGLHGDNVATDAAKVVVVQIAAELIDDEAGTVKNANLAALGRFGLLYSIPCLAVFLLLAMLPAQPYDNVLAAMNVDRALAKGFCILWIGCFAGVWLSYGIRKTKLTLGDLLRADEDRLAPQFRLIFAGLLTLMIGLLLVLNVVDIKLGGTSFSQIGSNPTMAFLLGTFCGVSEQILPASIGGRANALISSFK